MNNLLITLCLALLAVSPIYAQSGTATGLSNWDDVIEAVNEANVGGGGSIQLKNHSTIFVDEALPDIAANVTIEGNGATLKSQAGYNGLLVLILPEASLELKDLHITEFERGLSQKTYNLKGIIDNHGVIRLERITFSGNSLCTDCKASSPLLYNRSFCSMNNVTIYDNVSWEYPPIINDANMRIINSTLSDNAYNYDRVCGCVSMGCVIGCSYSSDTVSISASNSGITELGNTLLDENCSLNGHITDLGGNFVRANGCGLDSDNNVIGQSSNLGSFGYHGGLVPTVGLEPGSGAVDAGNNDFCSATDARFANRPVSGSIHSERKCDVGAFEYGGAFGNADLAVNGMNGLWFSLAADGHYVHMWRVSPDRVYLNWTAFDQSSEQMWIYAVADTVGESSFSATAYVNEGGQLVPGGAPEGSVANEWGSIEINLSSCTVGTFRYTAHDGAIGSGEFQIDRLAFIEGGGCSD